MAFAVAWAGAAEAQVQVTVNTRQVRGIGGVTQLDRARFFNHAGTIVPPGNTNLGNLRNEVFAETGLNSNAGRETSEFDQFILRDLPEDASRPGFADPTAVRDRIRGGYRNFVLNDARYESLRNAGDQAFFVNGGRYTVADGVFLPEYILQPGTGVPRVDAYVEFLNIYLEEAVFGEDAFHPVAPERYFIELINEPDLHFSNDFTRQDYIDFHREVAAGVRAVHPEANIGGPSLAITLFETNEFQNNGPNDFSRFEERLGNLIAEAGSELDFYSLHPYERYDVQADGSFIRALDHSPGRVDGLLDLIRARDLAENGAIRENGQPLPIAITEYGSFNLPNANAGNNGFGNYSRDEQQWDLSRDVREQLLVYLNRPDAIASATPFIFALDFRNEVPTNPTGDNVFFELDANGQFQETIVGNTFRAYNNVSGDYLGLEVGNDDIQAVAFRDGNEVYLLLNNLLDEEQTIDLDVFAGLGTIESASIDRLFRLNGVNTFIDDLDITDSFGSLVLNPDEGSVITLTLASEAPSLTTNEQTYYSRDTVLSLTEAIGRSPEFTIEAPIDSSTASATLRLTYSREGIGAFGQGFEVIINGETLDIEAGIRGIDDGDDGLQTREIEVPLELLVDGENTLQVDFVGNGGFLAASALVLTSAENFVPGDFNGDGQVDALDFLSFRDNFGSSDATLESHLGTDTVGAEEFALFTRQFGAGGATAANGAVVVPEPASIALLMIGFAAATRRRLR